jgi:hypothetical protein
MVAWEVCQEEALDDQLRIDTFLAAVFMPSLE